MSEPVTFGTIEANGAEFHYELRWKRAETAVSSPEPKEMPMNTSGSSKRWRTGSPSSATTVSGVLTQQPAPPTTPGPLSSSRPTTAAALCGLCDFAPASVWGNSSEHHHRAEASSSGTPIGGTAMLHELRSSRAWRIGRACSPSAEMPRRRQSAVPCACSPAMRSSTSCPRDTWARWRPTAPGSNTSSTSSSTTARRTRNWRGWRVL